MYLILAAAAVLRKEEKFFISLGKEKRKVGYIYLHLLQDTFILWS